MPLCKDWFSVKTPAGEELLLVKSTDVYNSGSNWSRVKIPGVTRSSASLVVRFTLNNVTSADAGKFYCTRVSDGSTISDCKHVLVVLCKYATFHAIYHLTQSAEEHDVCIRLPPSPANEVNMV